MFPYWNPTTSFQNGFSFKEIQETLPAQIQKEILFKQKFDLLEKNVFFSGQNTSKKGKN